MTLADTLRKASGDVASLGAWWYEYGDEKRGDDRIAFANELLTLADELEHTILVKPYSTELANGRVKYLWVRDAGSSAETWEEAMRRLQDFYDEEAEKAEGGVFYVRGGCGQGR